MLTDDSEILRSGVHALTALGPRHNRWHVRSVVVGLLQEIRTTEHAMCALDGLRRAGKSGVQWTLENDFVIRSLHPALRSGIEEQLVESNA